VGEEGVVERLGRERSLPVGKGKREGLLESEGSEGAREGMLPAGEVVLAVRESRRPGDGSVGGGLDKVVWKGLLLVAELGAPPAGRLVDVENVAFSVDCLPRWA